MKKWKFKNETPRFDGEYLCHIRVTEECGNKYKKYKQLKRTIFTITVNTDTSRNSNLACNVDIQVQPEKL